MLALFSTFGTETNRAIRAYANEHKVPQLFVEAPFTILYQTSDAGMELGMVLSAAIRRQTVDFA